MKSITKRQQALAAAAAAIRDSFGYDRASEMIVNANVGNQESPACAIFSEPVIPFRQRCFNEATRDVIFLLRYKLDKRKDSPWHVDSVWLSREEAEDFAKQHEYRWPKGWQVYGVCANGALASLLTIT